MRMEFFKDVVCMNAESVLNQCYIVYGNLQLGAILWGQWSTVFRMGKVALSPR